MSDNEWNVSVRFVFEFAMRIVFGFEGADRQGRSHIVAWGAVALAKKKKFPLDYEEKINGPPLPISHPFSQPSIKN